MKAFLGFLLFLALAEAGGIIVPASPYDIYCGGQVGFISFLGDTEALSIVLRVQMFYRSCAVVVPLPGQPSIRDFPKGLFEELSRFSAPIEHGGDTVLTGCFSGTHYYEKEYGLDYVEVIKGSLFNFVSTAVIQAHNADTIKQWLEGNGYTVASNVTSLLQAYINSDWTFFFVARTDSNLPHTAIGFTLTFPATTPVYPLKAASANNYMVRDYYDLNIPFYLYVVADDKMVFEGAELKYANRISDEEMKAVCQSLPELAKELEPDYFVTKLSKRYVSALKMDQDLMLSRAADNNEYREIVERDEYYYYYGNGVLWLIFIWPIYSLYRRLRRRDHKKDRPPLDFL